MKKYRFIIFALVAVLVLSAGLLTACNKKNFTVSLYEDGELVWSEEFRQGSDFTLPEPQNTIDGYAFEGWQVGDEIFKAGDAVKVNDNISASAVWKIKSYTVKFMNEDTLLYSTEVEHGDIVLYDNEKGGIPSKTYPDGTPYVIYTWDRSFAEPITQDTVFNVVWSPVMHTVTFQCPTFTVRIRVEHGAFAEYNDRTPIKNTDNTTVYTFKGWDKDLTQTPILSDTKFYPEFSEQARIYTVALPDNEFVYAVDEDGSPLHSVSGRYDSPSQKFRLIKREGVYAEDMTVTYAGSELTPDSDGFYSLKFTSDEPVAAENLRLGQLYVIASVDNADFIIDATSFEYGSTVRFYAKGADGAEFVPVVKVNDEILLYRSIGEVDGVSYCMYEFVITATSSIYVQGLNYAVSVYDGTYYDYEGNPVTAKIPTSSDYINNVAFVGGFEALPFVLEGKSYSPVTYEKDGKTLFALTDSSLPADRAIEKGGAEYNALLADKPAFVFDSQKTYYIVYSYETTPENPYSVEYVSDLNDAIDGFGLVAPPPSYVSHDGFAVTVFAPTGSTSYMYVEYASDKEQGFVKFEALTTAPVSGGNNYTFEVSALDCDVRYFFATEQEVYEVTFHYSETVTLSLEHGTLISSVTALPTEFEGIYAGKEGKFACAGWTSTQGAVSADCTVIDGKTDLWAVINIFFPAVARADDRYFYDVASAFDYLGSMTSGDMYMVYNPDGHILPAGNYTVPQGVTLHLPYALGKYGRAKGGTDTDREYPDLSCNILSLVIPENASLIVRGVLSVGGITGFARSAQPYQGHTSSYCAVINLDGIISVYGVLDCNGYIEGNGKTELFDGAEARLPFTVKDYRGGTNSNNVYSRGVAPFNIFEAPNVLTEYVINYGSTEKLYAMLYAGGAYNEVLVAAIGNDGIISLAEGGKVVKKTTRIANPRYSAETTSYEPEYEFRTTLDIYGGGKDNPLNVMNIMGTSGVFLGIPYTYSSITLRDGEYNLRQMYKIMPGASLNVAEDAVLNIISLNQKLTGSIITYDSTFVEDFSSEAGLVFAGSPRLHYPYLPNGADGNNDAVFTVNGTLNVNGNLAAEINCGSPNAVVNVHAADAADLTLTSQEAVYPNGKTFTLTYTQTKSATVNGGETVLPSSVYISQADGDSFIWVKQ